MIPLFMAPVIASGDPVRDDAGFPTSLAVLAVIAAVTYVFAYVLGPDRRLERAAWRRLAEAGVPERDPELGVVLAGAGSAHAPAHR
ncbi:MAG: hypothetical protein ABS976_21020, partial [Rhodococcus sp. (in: high G+C Gram-positive bacteria)]